MKQAPKTIMVSHRIFSETLATLSEVGSVFAPNPSERFAPAKLKQLASRADAMLAFMSDAVGDAWLHAAPRLRIIAGALKGCDNLDLEACTRRGVWVTNVPNLLTIPTAELTIGLMIALARHINAGDALIRRERTSCWRPRLYGIGIAGSSIGLIGLGSIGLAVAERLQPFGAKLFYYDPNPIPNERTEGLKLQTCNLHRLLSQCDILVVTAPLNTDSYHLLNDDTIARCKTGALLINPARGSVVDEKAVARLLTSGKLGGYAADVFECEDLSVHERPRRISAKLLAHPATVFTPHLGSAVHDARRAIELRAASNIVDWAAGRIPRDAVNRPDSVAS